MIVVDSSAVVAIFKNEPEAATFTAQIETADRAAISVVSVVESTLVLTRDYGPEVVDHLSDFLEALAVEIVPVDGAQMRLAQAAFLAYGKGRHPAGLNFGDCFVHALARSRGALLLYKGEDFARTDVARAG